MKQAFLFLIFILLASGLLFSQEDSKQYDQLENHAIKAPDEQTKDLRQLTSYLTKPAENERQKVWVIYSWITHHIRYDHAAVEKTDQKKPQQIGRILQERLAICQGYSLLLEAMCKNAGVESEVVAGYSKGTLTATPNLQEPDHAWNAVKIDGQWQVLDATWGSSLINKTNDFVQKYEEGYFLTKPRNFITNHLPALPMWQLLNCPISVELFQQSAEAIQDSIDKRNIVCYNFQDSIEAFRTLSEGKKKLKEIILTYEFNPTRKNEKQMGYAYLDYAVKLSNRAERLEMSSDPPADSLYFLNEQILKACQKGELHTTLYDWQVQLFASTLINQAVVIYNNDMKGKASASKYLEKAQNLLTNLPDSYYKTTALEQCKAYLQVVRE